MLIAFTCKYGALLGEFARKHRRGSRRRNGTRGKKIGEIGARYGRRVTSHLRYEEEPCLIRVREEIVWLEARLSYMGLFIESTK